MLIDLDKKNKYSKIQPDRKRLNFPIFGTKADLKPGQLCSISSLVLSIDELSFWGTKVFVETDSFAWPSFENFVSLGSLYREKRVINGEENIEGLLFLEAVQHNINFSCPFVSEYLLKFLFRDKTFGIEARTFLQVITKSIEKRVLEHVGAYKLVDKTMIADMDLLTRSVEGEYRSIRKSMLNVANGHAKDERYEKIWRNQIWLYD